jgi:hypothetical protein
MGVLLNRYLVENLETRLWIPPRVWSPARALGFMPEELHSGLRMQKHPWLWSLLQWDAYSGFAAGLTLTLLTLAAWTAWRYSRAAPGGFREILRHGKLGLVRQLGSVAARTLIAPGLAALLVYLTAVPSLIDQNEAKYDLHVTRLSDPAAARREIDAEIAAIRTDATLMDELRKKAE